MRSEAYIGRLETRRRAMAARWERNTRLHIHQWMVNPIETSVRLEIHASMDNSAAIRSRTLTSGMVVRGFDKDSWVQLEGEDGYVCKSGLLVKMEKWIIGSTAQRIFASASWNSEVIGNKPSGAVVSGYDFQGWIRLANEPGYMSIFGNTTDFVRMTWESFAEGLVDRETVEAELCFDVFEPHDDSGSTTISLTDSPQHSY